MKLLKMSLLFILSIFIFHQTIYANEKPEAVIQFTGHTFWVKSVAFSPDSKYALSGSGDKTLRLWDISTGKEIRTFTGHSSDVNSVAFSPNGKYALSGSDDMTIRLWNIENGKEIRKFEGHTSGVKSVAFSPDGKYALSGGVGDELIGYIDVEVDIETGEPIKMHEESTYIIRPASKQELIKNANNMIRFWNTENGQEIRRFEGHTSGVKSVAFSPDGKYALSGSDDKTLRLWEIKNGKEIRRFNGHTSGVNSVAFSPNVKYVLSGSQDKTLRLWEIRNGQEIRKYEVYNTVGSVAFSPDGKYAISGSSDGTTGLWDIASGKEIISIYNDDYLIWDDEPIVSNQKDTTPPVIEITKPQITRDIKIVASDHLYTIEGIVRDDSKIVWVKINNREANLNTDEKFWLEVNLGVGDNDFKITAMDTENNIGEKEITINREAVVTKTSPITKTFDLYRETWAVIIGIDEYMNLPFQFQLRYAVNDAKGVEKIITDKFKFDHIITLYNKNATKDNILKALQGELSKAGKDDGIFVFFAGHAFTMENTEYGPLGHLVPYDGSKNENETYKNISMTTLKEDVSKAIKAKHIFYVIDACYSGLLLAKRGLNESQAKHDIGYLKNLTETNVRQVLTAGSKDEQVLVIIKKIPKLISMVPCR